MPVPGRGRFTKVAPCLLTTQSITSTCHEEQANALGSIAGGTVSARFTSTAKVVVVDLTSRKCGRRRIMLTLGQQYSSNTLARIQKSNLNSNIEDWVQNLEMNEDAIYRQRPRAHTRPSGASTARPQAISRRRAWRKSGSTPKLSSRRPRVFAGASPSSHARY